MQKLNVTVNKKTSIIAMYDYLSSLFWNRESIGMRVRFLRHLMAGGTGTLFYMGFVIVFVEWIKLRPVFGVAISMVFLGVYTYIVNHTWVYDPESEHREAIPKFLISGAIALFLNSSIMFLAVDVMGWWYIWGLFSSVLIVPPTNFLMNYYWTFR